MRIQLALDGPLDAVLPVLAQVHPYVDIVEAGTPLIYREGLHALRHLRQIAPDRLLMADLKIMDAGQLEADLAFEAGADMVTVLGVANDATVRGAAASARAYGKLLVADMMQVADVAGRGRELLVMGCDYLCVHSSFDARAASPLHNLEVLRAELPDAPLAVAGGVGVHNLDAIRPLSPAIVVVGGSITAASDPAAAAQAIREML